MMVLRLTYASSSKIRRLCSFAICKLHYHDLDQLLRSKAQRINVIPEWRSSLHFDLPILWDGVACRIRSHGNRVQDLGTALAGVQGLPIRQNVTEMIWRETLAVRVDL